MSFGPQRFEFDPDGTLHHRGDENWREPICPECGEPILFVLDMFSFKSDDRGWWVLAHARCVWLPDGFRTQEIAARAKEGAATEEPIEDWGHYHAPGELCPIEGCKRATPVNVKGKGWEWHEYDCGPLFGAYPHWHYVLTEKDKA